MFTQFGRSFEAVHAIITRVCRSRLSCLTGLALVGIMLSGCAIPLREGFAPSHSMAAHNPLDDHSVVDWFKANYRTIASEAMWTLFGRL